MGGLKAKKPSRGKSWVRIHRHLERLAAILREHPELAERTASYLDGSLRGRKAPGYDMEKPSTTDPKSPRGYAHKKPFATRVKSPEHYRTQKPSR